MATLPFFLMIYLWRQITQLSTAENVTELNEKVMRFDSLSVIYVKPTFVAPGASTDNPGHRCENTTYRSAVTPDPADPDGRWTGVAGMCLVTLWPEA